jgi:hypothetical protein
MADTEIQRVMGILQELTTAIKRQEETIATLSMRTAHVETVLLEGSAMSAPPSQYPSQHTTPVLDCTDIAAKIMDHPGGILFSLYVNNDEDFDATSVVLSDQPLTESCVGRWGEEPPDMPRLYLGGPNGDTEFRRVQLIPACVRLDIPFFTAQCTVDDKDSQARAWTAELAHTAKTDMLVSVFHFGYTTMDTLYTPAGLFLRLIGLMSSQVYTVAFPPDITHAAQAYSNDAGTACANLCGNNMANSATPRTRALDVLRFLHSVINKYTSALSTKHGYDSMPSFCENFLPRFKTLTRTSECILPATAITWFATDQPTTDVGYLLRLIFMHSIVVSCAGEVAEAQDAVFADHMDVLGGVRQNIAMLRMLATSWGKIKPDEFGPGAQEHVTRMLRLADVLLTS